MSEDIYSTVIKQGAEGRLYKGIYLQKLTIVKERFKKQYRQPDLDNFLTKDRIKSEARSMIRCKEAGVRTPALYLVDLERRRIFMEYIDNSVTAKQYINSLIESESENEKLNITLQDIGTSIAKMHNNNIIHGDLTTSNILVQSDKVYFIDFGLSSVSSSIEDKAVDLYVLERALISTHAQSDRLLKVILDSYFSKKLNKNSKEIKAKLEDVRSRGRKRTMVG
ncbi:hypothetical protein LSTR_LSTR001165 [Laodelphax striatellus]|uniref:non-specific serine/threonine protein kinase n=1 Tax=Laodelphax striatellus TaxID=195883 RepID=A0A482X1C6_LAOST|nr:hypothetical protein LSTR_LSTR001165 [Laodelphax striatellus]